MTRLLALFFLVLTVCANGQNSTLLKNINFRANELHHSLDKTGDTLILKGERTIEKVEIFNNNFQKAYVIDNLVTKISLADIPNGRFVTEVKVSDKLIIITLLRHNNLEETQEMMDTASQEQNSIYNQSTYQNKAHGKTASESESITSLNTNSTKPVRFYWIVKHINKGHSSSKKMRLGDKEVVDQMIAQHLIDLKSKAGRHNKLTIWEVYDTSKFMRFKRQHPDYASVKEADCFNTNPFYLSEGR
ncbi:hypothetical protein BWZ20_11415 [Winogradskyella sp. J14-2]|uniref:hypothetical protein n=1 Tax=Winogradskyella sp. J14-2 TaxID=1936080 RepID=UPI000972B049|nr:hypothetical protein [Winogradskyella sp. J14-2]APY08872.1 hypothetical protein BWZ20_11415 [Winogradskyella sp. J14-2]